MGDPYTTNTLRGRVGRNGFTRFLAVTFNCVTCGTWHERNVACLVLTAEVDAFIHVLHHPMLRKLSCLEKQNQILISAIVFFSSRNKVIYEVLYMNGYNKTRVNLRSHNRSCECKKSLTHGWWIQNNLHWVFICRAWRKTKECGACTSCLQKTCTNG